MARIYIKRRKEPIEVENERARKIKALRFGDLNGQGKLDEHELIDLGDEWAGEIGQITAVEITKAAPVQVASDPDKEEREYDARMRALPIEKRVDAIGLGFVSLSWWMRSGRREKEPPEAVKKELRAAGLNWLKANPNATRIPADVYEPTLVKYWGAKKESLAESKRVIHKSEE